MIDSHRGDASYGGHCSKQNTGYLIAYEEWENSLSHKDRVLLGRAAGLLARTPADPLRATHWLSTSAM